MNSIAWSIRLQSVHGELPSVDTILTFCNTRNSFTDVDSTCSYLCCSHVICHGMWGAALNSRPDELIDFMGQTSDHLEKLNLIKKRQLDTVRNGKHSLPFSLQQWGVIDICGRIGLVLKTLNGTLRNLDCTSFR